MSKVIIEKLSEKEMEELGITKWPIWEKEVSTFDWTYEDNEQCYIIEGDVIVKTDEGGYRITAGDYVSFARGLVCTWEITKPIKKYYNFS